MGKSGSGGEAKVSSWMACHGTGRCFASDVENSALGLHGAKSIDAQPCVYKS